MMRALKKRVGCDGAFKTFKEPRPTSESAEYVCKEEKDLATQDVNGFSNFFCRACFHDDADSLMAAVATELLERYAVSDLGVKLFTEIEPSSEAAESVYKDEMKLAPSVSDFGRPAGSNKPDLQTGGGGGGEGERRGAERGGEGRGGMDFQMWLFLSMCWQNNIQFNGDPSRNVLPAQGPAVGGVQGGAGGAGGRRGRCQFQR